MDFSHFEPEAHVSRRARLVDALGERAALIPSGAAVSRNYPAATFPFRASSHFLYLVGLPLENAFLLTEGGRHTLFLPLGTEDDALWHGAPPSYRELADRTGLAICPLDQLDDAVAHQEVATIPAPDPSTRDRQAEALGRPPGGPGDAPLVDALVALRLRHDAHALGQLEQAAEATVAAHRAGLAATAPGKSEATVRAALEAEVLRRNMTTAYGPIVTVEGQVLHSHDYYRTLQDGDLLLVDFGAETAGGWAGDVTRTWPVSGQWSTTQREIYEVVLKAQEAAIARVQPGTRYRDVHLEAARTLTRGLVDLGILTGDVDELVADGVHALFFPHGVGHLLGLDVHDMEDLGDRAGYAAGRARDPQFGLSYLRLDRDLEAGMAVTIEPGFYQVPAILRSEARTSVAKGRLNRERLDAFADVKGIRIEDDVVVGESGPRVLTEALPKDPDAVAALVGAHS